MSTKKVKAATERAEKILSSKRIKTIPARENELLSSGCTVLNLACSGRTSGAFAKGSYSFIVGDSNSGKTFLGHAILAEASINRLFNDYRFIYDDVEIGCWMDIRRLFGGLADRIEPPCWDGKRAWRSTTVESLFRNINTAFAKGKKFIYIVDTTDGLTSEVEDQGKAGMAGAKAKALTTGVRKIQSQLDATGSMVIIFGQTHANIGRDAQWRPKVFRGGDGLAFYAQTRIWTSGYKINRTVAGRDRNIGTLCKAWMERSRLTGMSCTVEFPIYWSSGIDDLGACVKYLCEEKHWQKETNKKEEEEGKRGLTDIRRAVIDAPEFKFHGRADTLIRQLEEDNKERELRALTGRVWRMIVDECAVEMKRRY